MPNELKPCPTNKKQINWVTIKYEFKKRTVYAIRAFKLRLFWKKHICPFCIYYEFGKYNHPCCSCKQGSKFNRAGC